MDDINRPINISVIINTNGRRSSLAKTIESLSYLDYSDYEVCIVYGPTEDGTAEYVEKLKGRCKVAKCTSLNLSASRNIGIAISSGDVVAFIDDDAIPEPDWLLRLSEAYADPSITAAGGFVYDSSGVEYQWKYGTANRLGDADLTWTEAAPELNFPYTQNYPHLLGTNSSARRSHAIEIGGFDENFEYYLDETDFLCRLIDAGGKIKQLAGAAVHHKYRPSHIRGASKIVTNWYPIIKNKIYFSFVNNRGHHTIDEIMGSTKKFIDKFAFEVSDALSRGALEEADASTFRKHVDKAWIDGISIGINMKRLLRQPDFFRPKLPFLPFPTRRSPKNRRSICFTSQNYPPHGTGGIARYTHTIALALAELGHDVRVFTGSTSDRSTVDFENGVWVHRVAITHQKKNELASEMRIPDRIWDYSASIADEIRRVAASKIVDVVCAPIWDCEGLALLNDESILLGTSLHTTFRSYMKTHQSSIRDEDFLVDFAAPMLEAERKMIDSSNFIIANSDAIVMEIEKSYNITLDRTRLARVPHGLFDLASELTRDAANSSSSSLALKILYVGRLEERKGIDILLAALRCLLPMYKNLHVDIVGDRERDEGAYKINQLIEQFSIEWSDRCKFHGHVSEQQLANFYARCDIFVAPSRFESFGLIFLEAMIFGKPVIGTRAGGIVEVIEDNVTGLLANPDDVDSLAQCLRSLIEDAELRSRLGKAGRMRFEERFSASRMAEEFLGQLENFLKLQQLLNCDLHYPPLPE